MNKNDFLRLELEFNNLRRDNDSSCAWTQGHVIEKVVDFFDGCKNVLDIGSGVGKFVILSAKLKPLITWYGVEKNKDWHQLAFLNQNYFQVKNVKLILDDFRNIDIDKYEGFFIFNPFPMSNNYDERNDCVKYFKEILPKMKAGTKLVMYNKFCDIPKPFTEIKEAKVEGWQSCLHFYTNKLNA